MQPALHAPPHEAPPPPAAEEDTAAFDRWLRRELCRLYDPVLQEPVPDHLRRLLEGAARGES